MNMSTDKEIMLNELETVLVEDEQMLTESVRYGIDPTQQEQYIANLIRLITEIA